MDIKEIRELTFKNKKGAIQHEYDRIEYLIREMAKNGGYFIMVDEIMHHENLERLRKEGFEVRMGSYITISWYER